MDDQAAKLFAGHAGACAALVDVLIDKGIISQREVLDRFQRAQFVAGRRSDSRAAARELADTVAYLEPEAADDTGSVQFDRSALIGGAMLVVESEAAVARQLQTVLERAGAEVLVARNAAEALPRIAQFDFSAAVLEWRPDTREHRTLVRWLREDGVRFLYCAAEPPGDRTMASGLPILLKTAPPHELVGALARLTAAGAECGLGAV
jgi:CheY-like chemotaxis protein